MLLPSMLASGISMLYNLAISSAFLATAVLFVVRFYRTMASKQAYLTYSLPATSTRQLNCKLVTAYALFVVTGVFCLLSGVLFALIVAPSPQELWDTVKELFDAIFDIPAEYSLPVLLLIPVGLLTELLQFVFSIALGQRFKNRVLASVLIYFGINFAISTLTCTLFPYFILTPLLLEAESAVLWVILAFELGLAALYYFVSRHTFEKNLNLE